MGELRNESDNTGHRIGQSSEAPGRARGPSEHGPRLIRVDALAAGDRAS
jgi:hypothetical protein